MDQKTEQAIRTAGEQAAGITLLTPLHGPGGGIQCPFLTAREVIDMFIAMQKAAEGKS